MSETVNQETMNTEEIGKTSFTQEEVNQIVGERLARERAKYEDYESLKEKAAKFDEAEEASKTELQKATEKAEELQKKLNAYTVAEKVRTIREKVAKETGVPTELLTGETEEECKAWAEKIKNYTAPRTYPKVRDNGEPRHRSGTRETRDLFAEWYEQNQG